MLLKSAADARDAYRVMEVHNRPEMGLADQAGEPLCAYAMLRFRGKLWLCIGNGGGRTLTSAFLRQHLPDHVILFPFTKPSGWDACQDFVLAAQPEGELELEGVLAALQQHL